MIKLTNENTENAVKRCKQLKPKVRFIADRTFAVESANNGNVYNVRFDVKDGEKLGQCECRASERGLICYHIVAAATANIYRQTVKLQAAMTAAPYFKPNRPKAEMIGRIRVN
jgi:hypothetical protein